MSSFPSNSTKRRLAGFSLTEILVTIGIISILAGTLFPSLRRMQEASRTASCINNLKQIGVAIAAFTGENDGNLPSCQTADGMDPYAEDAEGKVNWIQRTWPYAYPGKEYKGFSNVPGLPVQLSRTIYECKQAEYDKNVIHKRSYGFNYYLGDYKVLTPDKMVLLPKPSGVCLVADVRDASLLHRTTINPRHAGNPNVLYADGHVAPVILTTAITEDVTYRGPFWGRSINQ